MEVFYLTVYSGGQEIESTYIVNASIKNNGVTIEGIPATGEGPLTSRQYYYNKNDKIIYSNCTFKLKKLDKKATERQ